MNNDSAYLKCLVGRHLGKYFFYTAPVRIECCVVHLH